jgi:hypothetical protein
MTGPINIIMAGALMRDLHARGVRQFGLGECEAMVARMVDCALTIEIGTRPGAEDEAPRRCETREVDIDLTCMACGAAEGEHCRQTGARD